MATSDPVPERPSDDPQRDSDDPVTFTRTIRPPAPTSRLMRYREWLAHFVASLQSRVMAAKLLRVVGLRLLILALMLAAGGIAVIVYCVIVPNPTRTIKILPPWTADETPIIGLIFVSATIVTWTFLKGKLLRRFS